MGNKNNKQFNNEKKHNKKDYKKPNNKRKVNTEIKIPLYLSADLSEDIRDEIIDVLNINIFNKISIPLNISRSLVNPDTKEGDVRVSTIGYIRSYDSESMEFTVTIFDNFINTVKDLGDVAMDISFVTYKDKFVSITKFIVIPVEIETVDEVNE
jgi:hypothetical protein